MNGKARPSARPRRYLLGSRPTGGHQSRSWRLGGRGREIGYFLPFPRTEPHTLAWSARANYGDTSADELPC